MIGKMLNLGLLFLLMLAQTPSQSLLRRKLLLFGLA